MIPFKNQKLKNLQVFKYALASFGKITHHCYNFYNFEKMPKNRTIEPRTHEVCKNSSLLNTFLMRCIIEWG